MEPLASTVAVSPRSDTTLPRIRTVRPVKASKYLALMRGVASEDILGSRRLRSNDRLGEEDCRIIFRRSRSTCYRTLSDKLKSKKVRVSADIKRWNPQPWLPSTITLSDIFMYKRHHRNSSNDITASISSYQQLSASIFS